MFLTLPNGPDFSGLLPVRAYEGPARGTLHLLLQTTSLAQPRWFDSLVRLPVAGSPVGPPLARGLRPAADIFVTTAAITAALSPPPPPSLPPLLPPSPSQPPPSPPLPLLTAVLTADVLTAPEPATWFHRRCRAHTAVVATAPFAGPASRTRGRRRRHSRRRRRHCRVPIPSIPSTPSPPALPPIRQPCSCRHRGWQGWRAGSETHGSQGSHSFVLGARADDALAWADAQRNAPHTPYWC